MHEMSLAVALMEEISAIVDQNNIKEVQEVELHVGVLKQIIPEMMQDAFSAASMETPAEGARLKQVIIEAQATCRTCKKTFVPTADNFLCPACGQGLVDILHGDEFVLQSLTCAT